MGRIAQAFSLAERYVGAYERYADATVRRYEEMRTIEERNAVSSERMTDGVLANARAEHDLGPHLADLSKKLQALAEQVGHLNWGGAVDAIRTMLPNGDAPKEGT